MTKDKDTKTVVPSLRFPEFRGEEGWNKKPLIKVAHVIAGQSPEGSNYNENGVGMPFYQGKTDFGEIFINSPTKWTTQTTKTANEGDILMSVRAPVGTLNISTNEICIGRGLAAIQPCQNKWFLYYFLNSIQNSIIGNGGSVFDSINKDQIEKIEILVPKNPKEQEKIANCFGSLDDSISAVGDKIEALKEHKKGLMQQLFPADGKTTPTLRFPEFHSAPPWQEKPMEEIFTIRNGYTPSKSNPDFWTDGTIPWFRMEDIRENGTILSDSIQHITPEAVKGNGLFPANSIIVATTATIGVHALVIVDSLANQQFTILTNRKSLDCKIDMKYFYYYMFIVDEWCKKNINAGGFASVDMVGFKKLPIPTPTLAEQQKIAECLSSVDELITVETEKLTQLKAHKKGLMQQLFPTLNK